MKPIEIHIEGYKIVISKDEQPEVAKDNEKMVYIPYQPLDDLLNKPFICGDNIVLTDNTKS